jgi:hypothetical protein
VTPQERSARITLVERITEYLALGGLFNPELMEHGQVKALLIDCRAALAVVAEEPPTLAERIAAPGFKDEVEKARALLDARDAGWNEGVSEALEIAGARATIECDLTAEIAKLLILDLPAAPPAEQGCPACGGGGAFYDRDHHKCAACGAIGGTGRAT